MGPERDSVLFLRFLLHGAVGAKGREMCLGSCEALASNPLPPKPGKSLPNRYEDQKILSV